MRDPDTFTTRQVSRTLARRLAAWAELRGPLVDDVAIEAMAAAQPRRVLEVGCGTGDYTEGVQRQLGVDLIAADLSARMVELARGRGLTVCQADIEALPFVDGEFDCVLANRVLYHLPDLHRGLAEIARVLRAGGCLVAVSYSERHLGELADLLGEPRIGSEFSAETGATDLGRHFDPVVRRDVVGMARYPTREALVGHSSQQFGNFSPVDMGSRLGDVEVPFDASYRHVVFVAHKRA